MLIIKVGSRSRIFDSRILEKAVAFSGQSSNYQVPIEDWRLMTED